MTGSIGGRVRSARQNKGLTIERLANFSGLTAGYVGRLERGDFLNPTKETIESLAKALGLKPAELQYGVAPESQSLPPSGTHLPKFFAIPLLTGTVNAGDFAQDFTNWEGETVSTPEKPKKSWVAWKVKGKSMEGGDRPIFDGDVVVLDTLVDTDSLKNQSAVIVRRNGDELTIKRFFRLKDGTIELRPQNPSYPTLVLRPGDEAKIVGKVVRHWSVWE